MDYTIKDFDDAPDKKSIRKILTREGNFIDDLGKIKLHQLQLLHIYLKSLTIILS